MGRAVALEAPRKLRLKDEPAPALGPRDVRLRALVSGISHGTELNLYRGSSIFNGSTFDWGLRAFVPQESEERAYPVSLGYELVGTVEEIGEAVTELSVGDLVHAGAPHREQPVLDLDVAARATYPLVRLPSAEQPERWLFVSIGAVALVALHDARVKLGDHVAIVGLGAIGLLEVQMARLAGAARITVVEPVASRRELALELGADEALDPETTRPSVGAAIKRKHGRGVDVAIETSGHTAGLQEAVSAVGLGGVVVTVGFYQGGAPELRLGEEWHHNRLEMVSSMGAWGAPHRAYPAWDRPRVMRAVVDLLASGRLRVDALPVRTFAFDEAVEAYRWLDANPNEAVKVALAYGRANPSAGGEE